MKHLTPARNAMRRVLQRARVIAIVGASASPDRHSHTVSRYLAHAGYDVIPVRPDRAEVSGRAACPRLAEVPGPVDLVIVFRTPSAVPAHIEEAAKKGAEAVWLPPGAWSPAADAAAERHQLTLFKECCVMEEHRHLSQRSGHPERSGVHVRRRTRVRRQSGAAPMTSMGERS